MLDFIENKLGIENAASETKATARTSNQCQNSPIVAKFAGYPDRKRVRKKSSLQKGTQNDISEQFPGNIMGTRRKLVSIMTKAKEEQKEAHLFIDKLFINCREYKENDN